MKSDKPQPAERAAEIAGKIGLKLPATAQFEHASYVEGHDDNARLIFRLPTNDWADLVKQAPFDQAAFAPEGAYHLGPDGGEWTPRREPGLLVAQIP
ncbi:MAG: hypothetical protein IT162_02930 [Bryobacterales bacterium]|nr:hypothetical protein [Bryobacterales bacterium]